MMGSDDETEPPHLYAAPVCRNAKYEAAKKLHRKADPLDAISDLKRSLEGQGVIRDIGKDPVKVYIWSPHQIRVYNKLRKTARLCIDASGGRFIEYVHVDGKKSHHIFLHIAVLHCSIGQFVVSSMLTEKQDMVTITSWLLGWIQSGAQYPKEVGCNPRITEFPTITITPRELTGNLENAIEQNVALSGTRCRQGTCHNVNQNRIHEMENIVLIGVDIDNRVKISTIPTTFRSPKDGEAYRLMGFVDYVGQSVTTRLSTTVGHYKAFARRNASWTVYDDMHEKPYTTAL
ncbi:hypothetical protein ACLKA7_001758 [Drosophila subpalustris]